MQMRLKPNGTLQLELSDDDNYVLGKNNTAVVWIPKEDVQKIRELLVRDSFSFLSEALNEGDEVYRP